MIVPKTASGRWAIGCLAGFLGFFVLLGILARSGQKGGETFFSNAWLASTGVMAAAAAAGAFLTGLHAVAFRKERSPFVVLAVVVGLLVTLFVLGEVLEPH